MPRRILQGTVVSDKMDKTVTVLVERRVMHEKYRKYVRKSSKHAAHDEANICKAGDMVLIEECRPISKNKSWKVVAGTNAQGQPITLVPFDPVTRVSAPRVAIAPKVKVEKKIVKKVAAPKTAAPKAEKKPAVKKETTKAKAK